MYLQLLKQGIYTERMRFHLKSPRYAKRNIYNGTFFVPAPASFLHHRLPFTGSVGEQHVSSCTS